MYQHVNLLILLICYTLIIYGVCLTDTTLRLSFILSGFVVLFTYPIISELIINNITKYLIRDSLISTFTIQSEAFKKKIPIVYSEDYNISVCGLEKLHYFDACKYRNVLNSLIDSNHLKKEDIVTPVTINRNTLLSVMTPASLLKMNYSLYLSKVFEMPIFFIPAEILRYLLINPMLKGLEGTLTGTNVAIKHGWAINLAGGYHHATKEYGSGFCLFPDITFAVSSLRKWHCLRRVMIIDLDAHQGNGHERDFIDDEEIFIVDCYNSNIFPCDTFAKKGIKKEILVDNNVDDDEYLKNIREGVKDSIRSFKPEFIIYNAGTDILEGDPLGNLKITGEGIIKRDEIVFAEAMRSSIPILMLLSGGYLKINASIIADSIRNLFIKFDLLRKLQIN